MVSKIQKRVLIVDDLPSNIKVLGETLKKDYRISIAKSGQEALEVVETEPPDLILLDVMMPNMDGYELCFRLKSNARTSKIPVIFITAKTSDEDEEKGFLVGGVDYIFKPFNPEIVKARVRTHIDLTSHQNDLENLVAKRTEKLEKEIAEKNKAEDVLKYSRESYRSFAQIGIALSVEKDIHKLLEMIVDEARSLSNADAGTLYIIDEINNTLKFEILQNDSMDVRLGGTSGIAITLPPVPLYIDGKPNHANVSSHVALTGETVNIEDVYTAEGFDFTGPRKYDEHTGYRSKSMLVIPLKNHENKIIGVLQLLNAISKKTETVTAFYEEFVDLVASLASQAAVALTNTQLIHDLRNLLDAFIQSIATAIDEKSVYTAGHVNRVVDLTELLANKISALDEGMYKDVHFNEGQMEELKMAAWMHDVGKIVTPEHVVDKSTKLETIYDRVEAVELRFRLIAATIENKYLRKSLPDDGTSIKEAEELTKQVMDDFTFVKSCNSPGEFMDDEKIDRLMSIAQKTFKTDDQEFKYLTENEAENLCIRKGSLTDKERGIIENHAKVTSKMLSEIPFPVNLTNVSLYAGQHHEKLDGSGYPDKIGGDDLPIQSRILAIADVFEALTAKDRPYKTPMKLSMAVKIMGFMVKDKHIDADLFDVFTKSGIIMEYAKKELGPDQLDEI